MVSNDHTGRGLNFPIGGFFPKLMFWPSFVNHIGGDEVVLFDIG
jgi:hypothetical protein